MAKFDRATQPQREMMMRLMKKAEYDERICSLLHQRLARDACVHTPKQGDHVDDWLNGMTTEAASRLITRLQHELA